MAAQILMALLLKFLISYFSSPPYNMHAMLSLFSYVRLFATLWSAAHQSPLSMELLQARILSGSFPDLGIKLVSPVAPTLQEDSLPLEPLGKSLLQQWGQ